MNERCACTVVQERTSAAEPSLRANAVCGRVKRGRGQRAPRLKASRPPAARRMRTSPFTRPEALGTDNIGVQEVHKVAVNGVDHIDFESDDNVTGLNMDNP